MCVENGEEELGFPAEVRVDGTLRVACSFGDLVQAGAVEASLQKEVAGGLGEAGARALPSLLLRQPGFHTDSIKYSQYVSQEN